MALSIGIVGLPNVGKSTTFNALIKEQNAQTANYPFCTIEPNRAIVPLPDSRVAKLAEIACPERTIYSTVEFTDIAGLVHGASKGEGLGNKFLSNIRECEAVLHVVRCFEDENITHIDGVIDPIRDIETIETELILADIETLGRKMEALSRLVKGNDKKAKVQLNVAEALLEHLNGGKSAATFASADKRVLEEFFENTRFLSQKRVIYAANVNETSLHSTNNFAESVKRYAADCGSEAIVICSKAEEEMAGFTVEERAEMYEALGIAKSGLDQIVRKSFEMLGLASYFTAGPKEVRSWTIRRGWKAPRAAGVIHSDFEKGFIRAEVISFDDYVRFGGESKAREAGLTRLEGKDYVVQDGDVMHFRFNV
jgi:GTP-binding protein YchF